MFCGVKELHLSSAAIIEMDRSETPKRPRTPTIMRCEMTGGVAFLPCHSLSLSLPPPEIRPEKLCFFLLAFHLLKPCFKISVTICAICVAFFFSWSKTRAVRSRVQATRQRKYNKNIGEVPVYPPPHRNRGKRPTRSLSSSPTVSFCGVGSVLVSVARTHRKGVAEGGGGLRGTPAVSTVLITVALPRGAIREVSLYNNYEFFGLVQTL